MNETLLALAYALALTLDPEPKKHRKEWRVRAAIRKDFLREYEEYRMTQYPGLWLEGVQFVPEGTERSEDCRIILRLTQEDRGRFDLLPPGRNDHVRVTDQRTGIEWLVMRHPCGLGCYCSATGFAVEKED